MKKTFQILGLVTLVAVIYLGYTTYPKLVLISGFAAKSVASGHFIDNRSLEMIEAQDNDIKLVDLAKNKIEEQRQRVWIWARHNPKIMM